MREQRKKWQENKACWKLSNKINELNQYCFEKRGKYGGVDKRFFRGCHEAYT